MTKNNEILRVGVVQLTSTDNLDHNVQIVLSALNQLKDKNCDLICLPENSLFLRISSADNQVISFNLKESFWSAIQKALAKDCHLLVGSVAYRKNKKLFNSTVLLTPSQKAKAVYHKIHLFDVDVPGAPAQRESAVFSAGNKTAILKIKNWRVGLSICYDVRFSNMFLNYAKKQVDLILVPAAFLKPTGQAHWHTLLRARAIETQAYVVAAAQSGGHLNAAGVERTTYGHSLVIDPWGQVLMDLQEQTKGFTTQVVELSKNDIVNVRKRIPMLVHRKNSAKIY